MPIVAGRDIDELMTAFAQELRLRDSAVVELCVIGGAALGVLGLASRPTKDIDVVSLAETKGGIIQLVDARPLPASIVAAIAEISSQFGIEANWLNINIGPAGLVDWGLPDGFESRLVAKSYGELLIVHFAGRVDQMCFKTYAAADVAGRHLTDLMALAPSADEMDFAFRWVVEQDSSVAFRSQLEGLADYLEVWDVLDRVPR